jgi:hypothetical protein
MSRVTGANNWRADRRYRATAHHKLRVREGNVLHDEVTIEQCGCVCDGVRRLSADLIGYTTDKLLIDVI